MRDKIEKEPWASAVELGPDTKLMILPGENRREFEDLHKGIAEELAPDGLIEEDLVLTVAKCIWRKWRYQCFLAAKVAAAACDPTHEAYDEELALKVLFHFLDGATLDWEIQQCLNVQKKDFSDHLETKCSKADFDTTAAWIKALQKEIREFLLPSAARFGRKPREVLMKEASAILTDEQLTAELEFEEQIDRKIENALGRLEKLKAAKRKGSFREAQRFTPARVARIVK
jgi:hypothetical protein